MDRNETIARLRALEKALMTRLENPRARYFDPPTALEHFERWAPVRDNLRSEFPGLLGDLPSRPTPASSGTTDHERRGYITREPLQQLLQDMRYCVEALSAVPTVEVPSMKVTREGVYFAGQYFDALRQVADLINQARKTVDVVDGYISPDTLALCSGNQQGITVRILTSDASPQVLLAAQAFNKQHGRLEIRRSTAFHDRFLVVDDQDFFHFGASFKDLGKRGFMFSRLEEPDVISAFRAKWVQEWGNASVLV